MTRPLTPDEVEFNDRLRASTRLPDGPDGSPRFRTYFHESIVGYCDELEAGCAASNDVEIIDLDTGAPLVSESGRPFIGLHVNAEHGFLMGHTGPTVGFGYERRIGRFEIRLKETPDAPR